MHAKASCSRPITWTIPARPGAVLGPKTVPKRTRQLSEAGVDDEVLYRAHVDLPDRLYGPSIRA